MHPFDCVWWRLASIVNVWMWQVAVVRLDCVRYSERSEHVLPTLPYSLMQFLHLDKSEVFFNRVRVVAPEVSTRHPHADFEQPTFSRGLITQGSDASWMVLDFFLENSRTWKVPENHFGPGKSWKLSLKVLESPGKISLKVMHFSSDSSGKQASYVNKFTWILNS